MPGASDSAEVAAAILESLAVDWALIGGLAANVYRDYERFTVDADVLVRSVDGTSDRIVDAFRVAGFVVDEIADTGEPAHLLLCRRGDVEVDVLLPVVEYQLEALRRSGDAHLLTVEDVIVHKLIAWRPQDQNDIASILRTGVDLDALYVDRWSAEFEVGDNWVTARRRSA